jgi:CubicO group peptidase (beta-lactamase class C family)
MKSFFQVKIVKFQFLVVLIILVPVLAACGDSTSTRATTTPTPQATSAATPTATVPARDFSEVDAYFQQKMAEYDIPGVALGLVQDGKIIYTKGYGVRDTGTKTPVTENTEFQIGSISKSFTSLAIMQLVDQGKLDLDTPIVKYLPDFKTADPEATQKLTLRHLLSLSSGLPATADADLYAAKDRQKVVADTANIKPFAQPGQAWQYTNRNYVIAAAVLERVSGQNWEDYVQQHVFNPLGMKTANFTVADMQKSGDFAAAHQLDVLKGVQPVALPEITAYGPAGSINANVKEMAEYARFQLGDGTFDNGPRLVSANNLNLMHTSQISATVLSGGDSPVLTNTGYGLGWVTSEYRGSKLVSHDGSTGVFFTNLFLNPATKSGVVILTNAPYIPSTVSFSYAASLRMVEWLLGQKPEQDLNAQIEKQFGQTQAEFKAKLQATRTFKADSASFEPLLGDYNWVQGKLKVTSQDGKLYVQAEVGQAKTSYELVPFATNHFLGNSKVVSGQTFEFKTDQNGTVLLYQEGNNIAQKPGKDVKTTEYKDPQGRFSATIPADATMQTSGDMAAIHVTNPAGTFLLTAIESGSDDLQASIKKVLTRLDPSFNLTPSATQALPLPDGRTWTQYLYQLPGDQSLAVVAVKDKANVYLVLGQAKNADIPALTPLFNSLLTGFKITA